MTGRPRTRLLCLLVLCVGLAACGGSSAPSTAKFKAAYEPLRQQVNSIGHDFTTVIEGSGKTTDLQLANSLNALAQRMTAALTEAGTLSPPALVQSDYRNLVSSLANVESDTHALAVSVGAHDSPTSEAVLRRLVAHIKVMTPYADSIKAKLHLPAS